MDHTTEKSGQEKKPISFGFSKKKEKQPVIEKSAIGEKNREEQVETDFVLELEGKEVKSVKPKEEVKELVIPLIQKNVWRDETQQGGRSIPTSGESDKKVKTKSAVVKDSGGKPNSIDDEAVKELIKEAAIHNEEWQQRDQTDLNLSIPLLMRNKVPDGYEEDDRLDVSLRPAETTGEDYEQVPIEQFGMAMLRGMGFKEEEGIGSKMKKSVAPVEVTVRPKGQGLGADKRPVLPKKQIRRKPGDKKVEEEPVGIAKGVGVLVTSGPHKNLYGKIEGVDDDNARVIIKLAISNQTVTLSQYGVQLVDKAEYKKCAKDLGKFSKGHDELAKRSKDGKEDDRKRHDRKKENGHDYDSPSDHDRKQDREERRHRKRHSDNDSDNRSDYERTSRKKHRDDEERTSSSSSSRRDKEDFGRDGHRRKREHKDHDHRKDYERDREDKDRRRHKDKYREDRRSEKEDRRDRDERESDKHDKKEKRRKVEDDYREEESHDSESHPSKPQCNWLRPDLRVRFIDKNYKKGRYYNSKVAIIDVVTMDTCTCRNDEGRLLEDVSQDMVETLIPKTDPGYVMVVKGQLKGQLGTVLKRDKAQCKAAVQLLQDRDQIVKLDYNDICEYVGDIQANDDY